MSPATILQIYEFSGPLWAHIPLKHKEGLVGTCRKCVGKRALHPYDQWVSCARETLPAGAPLHPLLHCWVFFAFPDSLAASGQGPAAPCFPTCQLCVCPHLSQKVCNSAARDEAESRPVCSPVNTAWCSSVTASLNPSPCLDPSFLPLGSCHN